MMDCSSFFFSSRRRHTRFDCDWSSDVCSSDLKHTANRTAERLFVTEGDERVDCGGAAGWEQADRKSTRLNSSHSQISYAVFCLKKKKNKCESKDYTRKTDKHHSTVTGN